MRLGAARAAAKDWVLGTGCRSDGYVGAYFAGSTVGLSDDAELAAGSDLDVNFVSEQPC